MLGNPFVTILYFFEQIEIHMGGSARASDLRTVLSFLLLWGLVVAAYFIRINAVIVCFAYLFSNNLWFGLGILQPFKVNNHQILLSKQWADIVFSGLSNPVGSPSGEKWHRSKLAVIKFFECAIVIGISLIA